MKERSIILKAQEVIAILEGRKTQLHRVIKSQPVLVAGACAGKHSTYAYRGGLYALDMYKDNSTILEKCSIGQIGDRLWVRETFTQGYDMTHLVSEGDDENAVSLIYKADGKEAYRACSEDVAENWGNWESDTDDAVWKSPVHMPRWASRILLEITNLRIERLNEISEADCVKEGVGSAFLRDCKKPKFIEQCEQIYGPDIWSQNPWVWVIDFRVIDGGAV